MKKIDELLSSDIISEQEKISGKSWNRFSHADKLSVLYKNKERSRQIRFIMNQKNDTHYGINWEKMLEICKEAGFKIGYEETYSYDDDMEGFVIMYHPEYFLVLRANSFFNKSSINDAEVYGFVNYKNVAHKVRELSGSNRGKYSQFSFDAREAMKHKINEISSAGNFVNMWKREQDTFLWLLKLGENTNKKKWDTYKEERLALCCTEMWEMMH